MKFLHDLPTTQLRILLSLLVFLATAIAVLGFDKAPPEAFYMLLAAVLGIDVAQYGVKRFTYKPEGVDVDTGEK